MTIDEMKKRKKELGYSNKMIADLSGVPLGTVQKIFGGATTSPRRSTIIALEAVLSPISGLDCYANSNKAGVVKEELFQYDYRYPGDVTPKKKQGQFTVQDIEKLPEDVRVELIDGVIYFMTAPGAVHQAMLREIAFQFMLFQEDHDSNCEVFFAPVDVRLDRDDKTVVEPDLLVICEKRDEDDEQGVSEEIDGIQENGDRDTVVGITGNAVGITGDAVGITGKNARNSAGKTAGERADNKGELTADFKRVDGAPDLVLEILSPSTRSKDCVLKLNKYMNAGCREYWIVDIANENVSVYDFANGNFPMYYTFQDKVPVGISGGELILDFAAIRKKLQKYFSRSPL